MSYGVVIYKTNEEYHVWKNPTLFAEELVSMFETSKPKTIGSMTRLIKKACGTTATNISKLLDIDLNVVENSANVYKINECRISIKNGGERDLVNFTIAVIYKEDCLGVIKPVIVNYFENGLVSKEYETINICSKFKGTIPYAVSTNEPMSITYKKHFFKKWLDKIRSK